MDNYLDIKFHRRWLNLAESPRIGPMRVFHLLRNFQALWPPSNPLEWLVWPFNMPLQINSENFNWSYKYYSHTIHTYIHLCIKSRTRGLWICFLDLLGGCGFKCEVEARGVIGAIRLQTIFLKPSQKPIKSYYIASNRTLTGWFSWHPLQPIWVQAYVYII